MVTVDTDDEKPFESDIAPNVPILRRESSVTIPLKLPPKRLKLLKRYARTNFEDERTPHGRGSSGFAAVQMTIDSEFGDSVDLRSSPPLPDSPTLKSKREIATTCIIIQQPSICCDAEDDVLIDPPEVENDLEVKRRQNMRLLEVANTLTVDQLQEFDAKYGSPHHSRSQSVRPRARPTFLSLPQARTRVASMPNTGVEETFYRLRHFSITGKVVVNKGDSVRTRRPRSKESLASTPPSSGLQTGPSSRQSSVLSCSIDNGPSSYKVVMLGASAVGKSSLISQFMTSEHLHTYDSSIDEEFGDKSVSVLLDGEESELMFVDHSSQQMSPTTCLENYRIGANAYCVVYSTADKNSFKIAESLLQNMWTNDIIRSKAVILVANKTDLVRSRVVSNHEGKQLATNYDTKYIETSVGFNHNVDELLVGLVSQIRLKQSSLKKEANDKKIEEERRKSRKGSPPQLCLKHFPKTRGARTSASLKVKGLLSKVWARDSKSKSCENLHVL